jgi:hypothetical protein
MPNLGNETSVAGTEVWLTPPHVLEALGEFDLDPCASLDRPWDTAKYHYTVEDDGLIQPWFGRVWCNPPYGPKMTPFLQRMAEHQNGIVLIFARTETKAFFDFVWDRADALLFLKGRLKFHKPDGTLAGTAGSPSVLIAYGQENVNILKNCNLEGKLVIVNA